MKRLYLMIFFICASLYGHTVWACSPRSDYLQPTNYELVKNTTAIILAEAVGFEREETNSGSFCFDVIRVLKGDFDRQFLIQKGYDNFLDESRENDFSRMRSGTRTSGCIARDYRIGYKYLLFLNRIRSEWQISGPAFTRINEEVRGSDSPWVKAVEHYIRISSLNNYEQEKIELKKLRLKALKKKNIAEYPPALVRDIDSHFDTPSDSKSFADLMRMYRKARDDSEQRDVLQAIANGKHREAKPLFDSLMKSGKWKKYIGQVCKYLSVIGDSGKNHILASAVIRHKKTCGLSCKGDQTCLYFRCDNSIYSYMIIPTLTELAENKDKDIMLTLLRSANEEEAEVLSLWFADHYAEEAAVIMRKLLGKQSYTEKRRLALALARVGDSDVAEWAVKYTKEKSDDRWVAYYVIAISPLQEANIAAKKIIHENNHNNMKILVDGYDTPSANTNKWECLAEIVRIGQKSAELETSLRRTLETLSERGETEAKKLLEQLK